MARVICIVNQKGGVGKTTTSVNLSASLAVLHKKTLLIDFDPQGNASSGLGIEKDKLGKTIYNSIIGEIPIEETIQNVHSENLNGFLHVSPSNSNLAGAEVELLQLDQREWKLKNTINHINHIYDYVVIDCPPSLSILTVNALTTANSALIPIQCEYYALEGLGQLQRTLSLIQQRLNPGLEIEGYLLTMFDTRNNICHSVANEIKNYFKDKVFKTVISRNIKLAESPSYGKPLLLYDIKSNGAENYMELAKELINNMKEETS